MTIRHEGFVCIGRIGTDYYFAESVFDHGKGFQGVTGCVVRPVDKDEWDWANERENIEERLWDYRSKYATRADFDAWVDEVIEKDGADHVMFDNSDREEASAAFTAMGIQHETTDCSGGGRIFGCFNGADAIAFEEVFDCKALTAIRAFEDGAVDVEYTNDVVFDK